MEEEIAVDEAIHGKWLEDTGKQYVKLSNDQKNKTLDYILDISSPSQLYFLQNKLEALLYRDFFALLPFEITEHICSYLDAKSLLNCCSVSRQWNQVVSNSWKSWLQACEKANLRVPNYRWPHGDFPLPSTATYYKQLYLNTTHFLNDLKKGKAFRPATYNSHLRRVTAIYYYKGRLATGADDRTLCIWDSVTDECLATIHTECTITNIKFNDEILVVASYSGCLKSWSMITLKPMCQYMRHITAVFSLDFSQKLDLLISGAADNCLKLWSLKTGKHLATLRGHTHWIVKVLLMNPLVNASYVVDTKSEISSENSTGFILSMDKDRILVWPLPVRGGDYQTVTFIQEIPIIGNDLNFFTPGLHCDGVNIYFVKQDPRRMEKTKLCKWNLLLQKMIHEKELPIKVKALLAVGSKYACVLSPWIDTSKPNIFIFSVDTLEIIAQWSLPPSRPSTPDCSQVTFGERDWLDGFTGHNHHGLVLAAGLEDNTVYALKFSKDGVKQSCPLSMRLMWL